MSKAGGLLLIAMGLGIGAYTMPSDTEDASQAAQTSETSINKEASIALVKSSAPTKEIIAPIPKLAVRPTKLDVNAEAKTAASPSTKATVITIAQRASEPSDHTQKAQKIAAALLPGDRVGLTRELQRELRRVGCYDGEVNGTWTPASRRAMKAFTDRVNASLPIEEPDYILLKLVQGSQDRACAAPCPTGQGVSEDGRCVPNAVIARTGKSRKADTAERQVATTSAWTTTTTAAAPDSLVIREGRMALAGPKRGDLAERRTDEPHSRLAAITEHSGTKQSNDSAKADRERVPSRGVNAKRAKPAVDKRSQRYVGVPRKKFGPWFFRQEGNWNN